MSDDILIKVLVDDNPIIKAASPDGTVVVDKGINIFSGGTSVATKPEEMNFEHGIKAVLDSKGNVVVELDGKSPVTQFGKQFAGIYTDLAALMDAIPNPTPDFQAIVLKPSEYYYEVLNAKWTKTTPVGAIHSGFLGVYDSLSDLNTAEPSPDRDDMAIVGTSQYSIYVYTTKWNLLDHGSSAGSDAKYDALSLKVAANKSVGTSNTSRIGIAEAHLQELENGGYSDKGSIDQTSDPKTLSTGAYYVTEAFVGAPALPSGDYVGAMTIQKNIDANNGILITYFTKDGIYSLQKYTGGWGSWVAAGSSTLPGPSPVRSITKFAGIFQDQQELDTFITNPQAGEQAILLKPSEAYWGYENNAWKKLADVADNHDLYLGVFANQSALDSAHPAPDDASLAIVGTGFKHYTGGKWVAMNDATLVGINARLTKAEGEIQANIKDVASLKHVGKTFVFNGNAQPVYDSLSHGNHILTFRAMSQTLDLQPPAYTGGNPDGMIITIFNDDTDNAVRFMIPLSTLGSNPNIPPENFASFVYKSATQKYTPMESGYIPIARINLSNYVKNQLKSDGLLHTFQDITDEGFVKGMKVSGDAVFAVNDAKWLHFNNAVVTETKPGQADITITGVGNSIDAVVDGKTYPSKHVITFKGMHAVDGSGNQLELSVDPSDHILHFQTIASRNEWSAAEGSKYTKVVAVVDNDGNGFVGWYEWDNTKWVTYNGQGIIMSDSSGAIPKVIKTAVFGPGFAIQQAGDQEDAALITYTGGGGGDDGVTINGKHITDLTVMAPLQIDNSQSQDRLLVDPRAYEIQHAASCLLQLDSDVTLIQGRATKLYTPHEIIPTGEYYSLSQPASGVNVQDNTGGDTAATGGELTRLMGSVSFYGKATDAGNVKVWFWYKDPASLLPGGILKDVNENPLVVERFYNKGDDLSVPLVVSGAMMATGNAPIVMYVQASVGSYIANPDHTLICIEQFSDGYETSLASIEFQRRLGIELHAEIKHFDSEMLSMANEIAELDVPKGTVQPHEGYDFINEFGIQNLTTMSAEISNNIMKLSDAGDITDFYVDAYLDNIKTQMLRGRVIDYDVTMANPQDAFRLEVYSWNGKADRAGRIYDSRNNGSLNLNEGFSLVKSKTIIEQPDGNFRGYTDSITVPSDAVNIFIILRPLEAQSPIELSIKDFTWGVPTAFRGYKETSRINLREQHLWFSENWAEFGLNSQGYASLRYTINNTPSAGNPMPVGPLLKGKAPVEIDNTVNQVGGSADPKNDGAIKFLKDGEASISKSYNVWNEQGSENTVTFWDVLIDSGGNESKIPDSERTFRIPGNSGAPGIVYTIPAYNIEVETGQRIGGRATSNKADGAYVQSQNVSEFIVQTEIDFKELKVSDSSDDPFADVDLSQFDSVYPSGLVVTKDFANVSSLVFPLDIPDSANMVVLGAVKELADLSVRPVTKLDWIYSNSSKTLTVSFGETVLLGRVTLGVYL